MRATDDELRIALSWLGSGARRDLLRVLTSPPHVRWDVIRQFYERPKVRWWAEFLIDLEEDGFARAAVVDVPEELLGQASRSP